MKRLAEEVEVTTHGDTYSKQEELDDKYPFQLCPECQSQDTAIIAYDDESWYQTGDHSNRRRLVFDIDVVHVNHICKTCGCRWRHTYKEKESKTVMNVDSDIAVWIISVLIFALSLFVSVCSWMVVMDYPKNESPWYLDILVIVSTLIAIESGSLSFAGLFGGLGL